MEMPCDSQHASRFHFGAPLKIFYSRMETHTYLVYSHCAEDLIGRQRLGQPGLRTLLLDPGHRLVYHALVELDVVAHDIIVANELDEIFEYPLSWLELAQNATGGGHTARILIGSLEHVAGRGCDRLVCAHIRMELVACYHAVHDFHCADLYDFVVPIRVLQEGYTVGCR